MHIDCTKEEWARAAETENQRTRKTLACYMRKQLQAGHSSVEFVHLWITATRKEEKKKIKAINSGTKWKAFCINFHSMFHILLFRRGKTNENGIHNNSSNKKRKQLHEESETGIEIARQCFRFILIMKIKRRRNYFNGLNEFIFKR